MVWSGVVVPVAPVEQVLGAPGSVTPSPSASQPVVEGSMPVVTGAVCAVVVEPLESVLAILSPLWRLRLFPVGSALAVPPVVAGYEDCDGTVTVSVGWGGVEVVGAAAAVSTAGVAGAG